MRMMNVLILGLLSILVACSEGTSKSSYLFKAPVKEGVAAKMGDVEISNQELANGIEADLYEAETKVFEIKFNKLKTIVLQKLIDKDSRKGTLTNDEFLEKYIAKGVSVSDKDIDKFIKEQNIPAEHLNPQVREKIKNYIEMEKKKVAVETWISEQTGKTPVEVYLQKPRRPTFDVQVGVSPSFGDEKAKVTIVEFSDFQCPYCAKGAEILKQIKAKYGNKVRVAFKNYPLPFHNHAEKAAVAGLCAHEQGAEKFWKMHDEMFAAQDQLDPEGLKKTAKKIGLEMAKFETCVNENKHLAQVQKDMEEGRAVNVKSTPTFFVNGQLINGAQPIEVFSELIDEELAK